MGRWSRLRTRVDELTAMAKQMPAEVPLIGRAAAQLLRVNLLDNSTRLAAQAFLSALPALFVVAVFAPADIRDGLLTSLRDRLGIQGATADQVRRVMSNDHGEEAQTFGVIGALVTLLSATALSRAMQRVCERCWELPRASARVAAWRWLVWLGVWLVYLVYQGSIRKGFESAGGWGSRCSS